MPDGARILASYALAVVGALAYVVVTARLGLHGLADIAAFVTVGLIFGTPAVLLIANVRPGGLRRWHRTPRAKDR